MIPKKRSLSSLLPVVLILVGCGDTAQTKSATDVRTTHQTPTATKAATGSTVKTDDSRYGKILVDRKGLTLYLFTADKGKGSSKCYGECAKAWPPYYTKGAIPQAGSGVDQKLLSSTKRKDGKRQVTYRGHPLYYYIGEKNPGEIFCQAVKEFGGYWYVVAPSGKAIRKA